MMLRKYMLRIICRVICLVFIVGLSFSCANDKWFDSINTGTESEGLRISLMLDGKRIASRTASDPSLNEDVVKRIDVFLFDQDETLMKYASTGNGTTTVNNVTLYQGSDWKGQFITGQKYTLYVVANYKGESVLQNVKSKSDLIALTSEDPDIAKWVGMKEESTVYSDKTFLMDGVYTFDGSKINSVTENTYDINVEVKRAAVKIEVTLNYSEEWKNNFKANNLKAQFADYATVTAVLPDEVLLPAENRKLDTYPASPSTGDVRDRFSQAPVCNTGSTGEDLYNGSTIRFYSYVNDWSSEVENETLFLIDLPGTITYENGNTEILEHNFYKIPIVPNGQKQTLERNKFYQIKATVDMEGSSEIDFSVKLTNVQLQVADWPAAHEINVGDNTGLNFLMLNEYHVDIRNVDGYDGLQFYSSTPLESVEIVGFDSQEAATNAGVDFTYPGADGKIPGAYFVNKDNVRDELVPENNQIAVNYTPNVTNGTITLTSPNPTNVTKRYITLKVTNTSGQVKYVVIEQYPLEYIQPIPGWYSYRKDLQEKGGTYETPGSQLGVQTSTQFSISYGPVVFQSLVVTDNPYQPIRLWYWDKYGEINTNTTSSFLLNSNNMMYFVTITKTDSQYKIAHPLMISENGLNVPVSSPENDNLISPSFMLASSLGSVNKNAFSSYPNMPSVENSSTWITARNHCAQYVETYKGRNGKTVHLDGWRLPTSAELTVIKRYQDDAPDVMSQVVSGGNYFISYGAKELKRQGYPSMYGVINVTGGSGSNENYVRCVRDVKPDDEFMQK